MQQSFGPIKCLVEEAMNGYDTHFLQLSNFKREPRGILVFNQDSSDASRVNLFNVTSIDQSCFEEVLDMALDFIWKTMHCASIRVFLHHYRHADDKMKVNEDIKALFKQRRFKWKTLKNEVSTGQRIEVLEGLNLEYKEQLSVETAFFYRRGLIKSEFMRDTLTFQLETTTQSEGGQKSCLSMPALVGSLVLLDSSLKSKLKDCEDSISYIREFLEKDRTQFFKSLMSSVSISVCDPSFDLTLLNLGQ